MYGDSRENLLEILAVLNVLPIISSVCVSVHAVATVSRIDKMIGLFCKILSLL